MACENMQVIFVVTGDYINSGGCSFLCNSPGSGPRGLGRDKGELVVGERSKGCYQRQGCLLQMVEIYALEINSHSPIHFKTKIDQKSCSLIIAIKVVILPVLAKPLRALEGRGRGNTAKTIVK